MTGNTRISLGTDELINQVACINGSVSEWIYYFRLQAGEPF